MFAIGEALEVEISTPRRAKMYMAGLVAFCRYAGRGFYEVGVTLRAAQPEPVFSGNPTAAMETMGWLCPDLKGP
jgi:hypothetical protein